MYNWVAKKTLLVLGSLYTHVKYDSQASIKFVIRQIYLHSLLLNNSKCHLNSLNTNNITVGLFPGYFYYYGTIY